MPSEARLAALIASTTVIGLCDGAGAEPPTLTIEPADSIVGALIDAASLVTLGMVSVPLGAARRIRARTVRTLNLLTAFGGLLFDGIFCGRCHVDVRRAFAG